jgi:amino acid permease
MTDATLPLDANNAQVDKVSGKATECDRSRFWIALAIIVGMLIILVISVAQAQYTQTEQLAAIFSGWITSIVAFYFYGQSNAQAQTQVKTLAQLAANSDKKANKAKTQLDKIENVISLQAAIRKTLPTEKATACDEILKNIDDILRKD